MTWVVGGRASSSGLVKMCDVEVPDEATVLDVKSRDQGSFVRTTTLQVHQVLEPSATTPRDQVVEQEQRSPVDDPQRRWRKTCRVRVAPINWLDLGHGGSS